MSKLKAFNPAGPTLTIAATVASANGQVMGSGSTVRVLNASAALAFVAFGVDNTIAATLASYPIEAGASRLIDIGSDGGVAMPFNLWIAVILFTGATGANVYVTRGDGNTQ